MSEDELRERLHWLLVNNEDNKRTSAIERVQWELITKSIERLSNKYKGKVDFDFNGCNTKEKKNGWFITSDGEVKRQMDGYNDYYDCKKFDGIIGLSVAGRELTLFFILKGVENPGGHQRNAKQEIGMYSKAIQKNNNRDYHFFFVLDGTYINKRKEELDKCEKYDVANSETIESLIESLIIKNLTNYGKIN